MSPAPPFPNNASIPLIHYSSAAPKGAGAPWFENTFTSNGWPASWRNGVYSFHHFHSTAHEALGCYSGSGRVLFGGPDGIEVEFKAGDAVLVPAGVGHCLLSSNHGFAVVGAYPAGTHPDLLHGRDQEYQAALRNVSQVQHPSRDPVMGSPIDREN